MKPYLKILWKNWVESRSSSRAESVYTCSDFLYGVRKHQNIWAISRLLSGMVSETKARENLDKLQGSLRSSVQGNQNIIKDLKDQRIFSKRASYTIQWGSFCQDTAVPHPGSGKSRNGDTSRKNLGCAVDEDNIRAIEPSRYPNRETQRNPIIPVWKNYDIVRPRPSMAIGRPEIRPHQIRTRLKTEVSIPGADKNSTLTGISHLTCTKWRNIICPQLVASQNNISLPILNVNSLISNNVFNTDAHRQWR